MKLLITLGYCKKLLACEFQSVPQKGTIHHYVISERELLPTLQFGSAREEKTQLKVVVSCNTVALALTNKHDTVVGSIPRANQSTRTDGC